MKWQRFASIPVFIVIILLGFVYYVTIFIFLEDWLGLESSAGTVNALIFTVLASLCVFSFLICVLKEPGHVPPTYVPDVEDIKTGVQGRHCDKCSAYKPSRAHHCRSCRRCILKMDHHCKWINNCVGYRNYKAFIILLLYATMSTLYSSVVLASCAVHQDWNFAEGLPRKIFYIDTGLMIAGLSLTLGTLLAWHIYLVIHNMTTIEYYEDIRAAWLARKSGQSYHHPFNVGAYKNITLVFGPNMLKWLCPTAVSHLKDGIAFPTARDNS